MISAIITPRAECTGPGSFLTRPTLLLICIRDGAGQSILIPSLLQRTVQDDLPNPEP